MSVGDSYLRTCYLRTCHLRTFYLRTVYLRTSLVAHKCPSNGFEGLRSI